MNNLISIKDGNKIYYNGVEVGTIKEDSMQALNFKDVLENQMNKVDTFIHDYSEYDNVIDGVLELLETIQSDETIDDVKYHLDEYSEDIEYLKEVKNIINEFYYDD